MLKVEYYFEYISSFFLIPPLLNSSKGFFPSRVSPQHPYGLNLILDFYVCCALSFVLCVFLFPADLCPGWLTCDSLYFSASSMALGTT